MVLFVPCEIKTQVLTRMAQRTVQPEKVKTLADWVARWPKATNLGFDPETREPTIYDTTKGRTKISSIPWKREADTLTVLAQPTRFSVQALTSATSRFDKIRTQRTQIRLAGEEQLRLAEANLLDAWRIYYATPPATRGPMRRDILSAEATLRDLEDKMAPKGRVIVQRGDMTGIYIPPMPAGRRGISLVDGASESVSAEESKQPTADEASPTTVKETP